MALRTGDLKEGRRRKKEREVDRHTGCWGRQRDGERRIEMERD